jgi:hypothetical protein
MARGPYYQPGRYLGKVINQQLGETSKGNPQVVITFQILGRINPEDPEGPLLVCGEHYDRSVFRAITDKTIDWVLQDLERLGFDGQSFADIDLNTTGCCDLRNRECEFSCAHEPHYRTGEPREVWQVASDGGGLEVKPLDAKQVRQLDAMFGKQLKQLGKKKDATTKTTPITTPEKPVRQASPPPEPFPDVNAQPETAEQTDGIPF